MNPSDKPKQRWLYVLLLEKSKYYVGITALTPEARFLQHKNGFNAAGWTRKYKPIRILDTKNLGVVAKADAERFENKVVRKYIKQYGINNVRGGDIRVTEDLVPLFGYYRSKDQWIAVKYVWLILALMLIVILVNQYK